jgi:hypothetical protein
MSKSSYLAQPPGGPNGATPVGVGIAQQGNLRYLEKALREHWNLGQNLLLCWSTTDTGIVVLMAPHYFLARFSASLNDCDPLDRLEALNGSFIRKLIAGTRQMPPEEFASTARRLELSPTTIKLPIPVHEDVAAQQAAEAIARRYSISYVANRAVLLFDIVDFSRFTPFEQASQLNSLNYSLNSAYNKLLKHNINIEFARTTTGDGFYIWNRDLTPGANIYLFHFMLLVVANNTIARGRARPRTVPFIRTGFHVGSHYEFSQAEGLNPSVSSYIVGDVTIDLARMLSSANSGQIVIGEFVTRIPTSLREGAYLIDVDTIRFVERIRKTMNLLKGLELSGEQIKSIHCYLSGETGPSGGETIRSFQIVDKHGYSRFVYNVRINIRTDSGRSVTMGTQTQGSLAGDAAEAPAVEPPDDYTGLRRAHGTQ